MEDTVVDFDLYKYSPLAHGREGAAVWVLTEQWNETINEAARLLAAPESPAAPQMATDTFREPEGHTEPIRPLPVEVSDLNYWRETRKRHRKEAKLAQMWWEVLPSMDTLAGLLIAQDRSRGSKKKARRDYEEYLANRPTRRSYPRNMTGTDTDVRCPA